MVQVDNDLLVQDPSIQEKRYLHRGQVKAVSNNEITAVFADSRFEVAADQDIAVFYNTSRRFLQQAARVVSVETSDQGLVLKLVTRGDPVSAEGREHYRVSTASADIRARIGDESGCELVDVSIAGFAVISRQTYKLGETVEAVVDYNSEVFSGTVCVQSVRNLGRGRNRYGMRYLEDRNLEGTLRTGLQKISLAVERELLKNQSGKS